MSEPKPLPKYDDLLGPTLQALQKLGGSGNVDEIVDTVSSAIGASEEQLSVTYPSGVAILPHRMAWARTALKYPGFLENPKQGVWVITEIGRQAAHKTNLELKQITSTAYKNAVAAKTAARSTPLTEEVEYSDSDPGPDWSEQLLDAMSRLDPGAFERLCQRLLREYGFTKVEVTGKSGDGGIDGVGVLRVTLISFNVLFQCKRWKSSVGSEVVRNFRGAMQGRADKGLIITTSTFTIDARKEAARDGAPAIDLIDGEALCGLLRERRLGVHVQVKQVEEVAIDRLFFDTL